jgi:phage shock protein PspC (stress-responsive transcriptional regulator)
MNKRLYRGNGYIAGVCEGLGEWSGIPSILWRILAIFLASFPVTVVIYILLWIFVEPKK